MLRKLEAWETLFCVLAVVISLSWGLVEHLHGRHLQAKLDRINGEIAMR